MSKKANPTAIGIFIFAGMALAVGAVLLLTSSRLLSKSVEVIVYFESSLNGLREGAPVKYRGVTIGSVARTMIHFNQATNDTAMPVILEIREELIRKRIGDKSVFDSVADLNESIRRGLRARLESESLVTGVLYIELEVENSPDPPVYHQLEEIFLEIPSRHTRIQQMMQNLATTDFSGLERKVSALIVRVDSMFEKLRLEDVVGGLTNLLGSVNRAAASPDLTNSFASLKGALDEYRALGAKLNTRVDPVADGVTNTLASLERAADQAGYAMRNLRGMLASESPLRHELGLALQQLSEATQSIAELAEYLQNNPNAILTGRKASSPKP